MIFSRFTSFIKDFVIFCYQVTELFCSRCGIASALPARSPRNLGSLSYFAISVFWEVNINTVLPRYHFGWTFRIWILRSVCGCVPQWHYYVFEIFCELLLTNLGDLTIKYSTLDCCSCSCFCFFCFCWIALISRCLSVGIVTSLYCWTWRDTTRRVLRQRWRGRTCSRAWGTCRSWDNNKHEIFRIAQNNFAILGQLWFLTDVRTRGVSSKICTATKSSKSWTYTVASSSVCTSPLVVITVVVFLDARTVSSSAELRSFLLSMCIDAPASATNVLSSGFFEDGAGNDQTSERE